MSWREKLDALSKLGTIEIGYRDPIARQTLNLRPFHISVRGVEIKEDGMLVSTHGNGNTVEEAVEDYWNQIESETLVTNATSSTYRREWHWAVGIWKRV